MNPFNVPTGGQDPATKLMNIGTLQNPVWVSKDSGNYKDWLASGSAARTEGGPVAPATSPALAILIYVALGLGAYLLYRSKWR